MADRLPPTPDLHPQRQPSVDATVLADHLPSGYTAAFDSNPDTGSTAGTPSRHASPVPPLQMLTMGSPSREATASAPAVVATAAESSSNSTTAVASEGSSLKLQGGDMHRDLFKLDASSRPPVHRRAHTFHLPHPATGDLGNGGGGDDDDSDALSMTVSEQRLPGGFRRQFLLRKQQQAMRRRRSFVAARMPVTRNFVEFLELYGNFAGEELEDSDDEEAVTSEEDEEEGIAAAAAAAAGGGGGGPAGEMRPLLGHRKSSRAAHAKVPDASTTKAFFTLLKAFVGTGIMFLPKAFNNGGLLFSTLAMLFVSGITMFAFHLLLQCKRHAAAAGASAGYGEIGAEIAGRPMRALILFSITLSQLGFVCSGIVFVAENITGFLEAVTSSPGSPLSTPALIGIQLILLVPLSFIRNISKLGPVALLADTFILLGVGYIFWYCIGHLAANGIDPSVVMFNPARYTLTLGSAIFTFEGIGLILPIESSMVEPHKFEPLLGLVMAIVTVIFTAVGVLCYATFGVATRIEIISNFPQDSALVNVVQFLYAFAVLAGNPVQLFPAVRILEVRMFGHRSGRRSVRTKWIKNAFRACVLLFCAGISFLGAGNLDRFVALIGSVACVPLVYVYPPFLHYKAVAETRAQKGRDLALMALGTVGMVYTTTVTIVNGFL